MLNVHELERTWFRYKIRRYVPVAVAGLSVTILSIMALIFWPDGKSYNSAMHEPAATENFAAVSTPAPGVPYPPVASESRTPTPKPVITPVIADTTAETQKKLTPSMGFMQSLEEDAMPYYGGENEVETVPQHIATVAVPTSTPAASAAAKAVETTAKQEQSERKAAPTPVVRETPTVSITPKDANDLQDVIKRFKTNKNPALSLFVARRYYDLGEYQSAYDYALKTNEIDSNIEESWLIFAKSLVKIGEEEQAKKVLQSYIQHSGSMRAKSLLESIQKGTFQ